MGVSGNVLLVFGVIVFIAANAYLMFIRRKNALKLQGVILPITYDQMPENNAELRSVEVEFETLKINTAESSPIPMKKIQSYLAVEDSDLNTVKFRQLTFLRTAKVAEKNFWIWKYHESDGTECYVTVVQNIDGSTELGMDGNDYSLSPEQFMLGVYHNVF